MYNIQYKFRRDQNHKQRFIKVKLLQVTEAMVYNGLPIYIFLENFQDFDKLFWVVALTNFSTDENIFKVGNIKVTNFASIDTILMCCFV